MWGYGWHFGWFFPLFMMLFMFFVCAAFAYFFFFRPHHDMQEHMMYRRCGDGGDPTRSALQILNERFARGEIQKPEYDEKKAAILSG
jgi:putative membrane protein